MNFYSHGERNSQDGFIPTKPLISHLKQVTQRMLKNLSPVIGFTRIDSIRLIEMTRIAGIFHDFGKYTSFFQEYLQEAREHGSLKNHALISGILAFNYFKSKHPDPTDPRLLFPYFLYFCVRSHHSSLKNILIDPIKSLDWSTAAENLRRQKNDLLQHFTQIQEEYADTNFEILPEMLDIVEKEIKFIPGWLQTRLRTIEHYFFILYFFSLLIESDKIDASQTDSYQSKSLPEQAVNQYLKIFNNSSFINTQRESVKQKILDRLNEIDLNQHSLFTLTAPTGIGKTLTSLNFVLHLRERIFQHEKIEPLVIYTLPFINIIEQTVMEFEKVFKPYNIKIVKHHQYTDLFSDCDDISSAQLQMQLETWQGDLIVTTFVQLLQTIIGNRNSLLKKFHQMANSIIILDEVQNIDVKYWPLIGATFYYLSKYLNARIILMTATQPLIFETAVDHILDKESISLHNKIFQLLPDYANYFHQLKRTKLVPILNKKLIDEHEFLQLFQSHWQPNQSALIVMNTIASSLAVYSAIKNFLEKNHPKTRLFYLSTNIIPRCRQIVIYKIRKALGRGEKPILVATQCIEAGVDLDFDLGFRDLGPLDSVIQVAGRINRHGKKPIPAPLFVFEFKNDATQVYGAILPSRCKMVLQDNGQSEINEPEYLTLIQNYYTLIAGKDGKSMQVSIEIFEAMKKLRFTRLPEETELAVEDFQLIQSRLNYADVFVTINHTSERIRKNFQRLYLNENDPIKRREAYMKMKKNFHSHIISVPRKKLAELEHYKIFENMFYIPLNALDRFYNTESGFIHKPEETMLIF